MSPHQSPYQSIQNYQEKLTQAQLAEYGQEMAKLDGEINQLNDEKKVAADHFKARITAKYDLLSKLADKVRNGYVDISIPCDIYTNLPTNGLKVHWDPAGMRVIKTEPMNSNDRQESMFDSREVPQPLLDELNKGQVIPPEEA